MEKSDKNNHENHNHGGYGVDHTTIIYLMNKNGGRQIINLHGIYMTLPNIH